MKAKKWTLLATMLLLVCFVLAACGDTNSDTDTPADPVTDTTEPTGGMLAAPTDFTFDPETGSYSFTNNDENTGYFFIRVFPVINGVEASQYVATSSRINGNTTGTLNGSLDVSTIGWGEYHVKLIPYAASGSGYDAPSATMLDAYYGVGGVMERPEMLAITDGSHLELTLDWYSLSDYKDYQYMPTIRYSVYSDAECTQLVESQEYDTSNLVMDTHPAGAYIWEYGLDGYPYLNSEGGVGYSLTPQATFTLEPGTYYVTCQALSIDDSRIAPSQVSDVIEVTITDEEPNGEFISATTSLWQDIPLMGVPSAAAGSYPDRVDFGQTQTTTATVG